MSVVQRRSKWILSQVMARASFGEDSKPSRLCRNYPNAGYLEIVRDLFTTLHS